MKRIRVLLFAGAVLYTVAIVAASSRVEMDLFERWFGIDLDDDGDGKTELLFVWALVLGVYLAPRIGPRLWHAFLRLFNVGRF